MATERTLTPQLTPRAEPTSIVELPEGVAPVALGAGDEDDYDGDDDDFDDDDDDDFDEFAFPISFLYHVPLSPGTSVGVYLKPGITFFTRMAGDYYDVGIGPSFAIGVEFLQHKRVHIPLELRYEPLWNAQPHDPA